MLSDPRYRPPTPVLVDSEVRGTTLQKLIMDEVKSEKVKELKKSERVFGPLNRLKISEAGVFT